MIAPIEAPHGAALETEARALADSHGLSDHPPRAMPALSQLRHVPDWLVHARSALDDSEGAVAKAAEWLLDNEYLVARAVRQIEQDLPKGFYAHGHAIPGRLSSTHATDDRGALGSPNVSAPRLPRGAVRRVRAA